MPGGCQLGVIRNMRELAGAWCCVDYGLVAVAVIIGVGVESAWAASLLLGPATTIHPWETAELHHFVVVGQASAVSNLHE